MKTPALTVVILVAVLVTLLAVASIVHGLWLATADWRYDRAGRRPAECDYCCPGDRLIRWVAWHADEVVVLCDGHDTTETPDGHAVVSVYPPRHLTVDDVDQIVWRAHRVSARLAARRDRRAHALTLRGVRGRTA